MKHIIKGKGGYTRSNLQNNTAHDPERRDLDKQATALASSLRRLQRKIKTSLLRGTEPERAQRLINRSGMLYARLDEVLQQLTTLQNSPARPQQPRLYKPQTRSVARRKPSRALFDKC